MSSGSTHKSPFGWELGAWLVHLREGGSLDFHGKRESRAVARPEEGWTWSVVGPADVLAGTGDRGKVTGMLLTIP